MGRWQSTVAVTACLVACACAADRGDAAGEFEPAEPGVLVVATNLPAPGFWNGPADAPTGGFEFRLAEAIAEHLGLDAVRVVDLPFASIVGGDLGGADLALAQITPTSERDELLDFTTRYLDSHPAVLARPNTQVRDVSDAQGLSWIVQAGTTQVALLDEAVEPDSAVTEAADIAALVDAVRAGEVDAALLDLPSALVQERLSSGSVVVVAQFATDDGLAVAVPDGSSNLESLDSAVRALVADGTVRELAEQELGRDSDGTQLDVPLIRARPVDQ